MICNDLLFLMESNSLKAHLQPDGFVSGVVFGVSASPDIPMPEKWMPWVLKGPHDIPLHDNQVNKLADGLICQLQWQLGIMKDTKILLPEQCKWSENEQDRMCLQQWLQGVLYAHSQLEEVWFDAWQRNSIEEGDSRLSRCLKCFSVLANSNLALAPLNTEKRKTLHQNLPTLFKQLNALLVDYVNVANELAATLPGQFEIFTETPKFE